MQIEWPNIAIGTGTGTTYTSDLGFTWVWSGQNWNGVGGNQLSGFLGPWVIFNSVGAPTTYTDLSTAMSGATSGDTIHLYGNASEVSNYLELKDNVNINFNGNTYFLDDQSADTTGLLNSTSTISCKMYNGTVKMLNSSSFCTLIYSQIPSSSFVFEGVNFETVEGKAGYLNCNVDGGSFSSVTSTAVYLAPGDSFVATKTIFQNIYGFSQFESGITVGTIGSVLNDEFTCRNLTGVNQFSTGFSTEIAGLRVVGSSLIGHLYDCVGISYNNNYGSGIYSSNAGYLTVLNFYNCCGISTLSNGFKSSGSNLYDCTAEGNLFDAGSAFLNIRNSNYYGCSDSQPYNTGTSLSLYSGFNCNIENCCFSARKGIVLINSSDASSYAINIKNCTIRAYDKAILHDFYDNNFYNIEGCAISTKVASSPIRVQGASGGRIANNTISSIDYSVTAILGGSGSNGRPQYQGGNVALDCQFNYTSVPQLIGPTASVKGNLRCY
jgi:hypothetical protein